MFNLESYERVDKELLDPDCNHPKKIVFQEICFLSRITVSQVQKYQVFLLKRIRDIEAVIKSHFDLIKTKLIATEREKFDKEKKRRQREGVELSI